MLIRIAAFIAVALGRIVASALAANPPDIEQHVLWQSGEGGYHTYRIPALLVTPNGTVLAVCEGRKTGAGDHGDVDLILKRSTDGGRTWSAAQLLYEEGGEANITIGNPCLVADAASGAILIAMTRNNKAVLLSKSDDDGVTWSTPRDLSSETYKPDWTWVATGPGVGIQLNRSDKHKGRLVIPCDHKRKQKNAPEECNSHVMLSDDAGETWRLSQPIQVGGNECQVVELDDGSLLLNSRMQQEYQGHRGVATSDDGGETWSAIRQEEQLPCPKCQGSIIRYDGADAHALLFSNPGSYAQQSGENNKASRERMTVGLSPDSGKTWPQELVLHPGRSAYSSLAVLPSGEILCLYEGGDRTLYQWLKLARFSIADIESVRN